MTPGMAQVILERRSSNSRGGRAEPLGGVCGGSIAAERDKNGCIESDMLVELKHCIDSC